MDVAVREFPCVLGKEPLEAGPRGGSFHLGLKQRVSLWELRLEVCESGQRGPQAWLGGPGEPAHCHCPPPELGTCPGLLLLSLWGGRLSCWGPSASLCPVTPLTHGTLTQLTANFPARSPHALGITPCATL